MKKLLLIIIICMSKKVQAQNEMPLYKNIVPNSIAAPNKENSVSKDNVLRIAKVSVPTLTVFKAAQPNGKAVIICPGGRLFYFGF